MRYPDLTKKVQDLTSLDWKECMGTQGTSGSFLKATSGQGTATTYYKASTYDQFHGFFGHECINELVAARLAEILQIPHARYSLVHAKIVLQDNTYVTWINACPSYRHSAETKQSFAQFYEQAHIENESPLELCDRMGWGLFARQMMLFDYLIINQDRHGGNIEVLHLKDGGKRLAPLFDNGNSLLFSCYDVEKSIRSFDPLVDAVGTNFIGSKRLADNLKHVSGHLVSPLTESHKPELFRGLDGILPSYHLDKIWEIIWSRWCEYAHI